MQAGWAAFIQFETELCCRTMSFQNQVQFFDCIVTPRLLYGAAALTLTGTLEKSLQVARRRMPEMVLACCRKDVETWVDRVKPVTHAVEYYTHSSVRTCSLLK